MGVGDEERPEHGRDGTARAEHRHSRVGVRAEALAVATAARRATDARRDRPSGTRHVAGGGRAGSSTGAARVHRYEEETLEGEASALQGLTEFSEHTRQRVDAEVKRIVGEAHDQAIRLLTEHRERLDSLAEALLRAETLDQPEAYAAAGLAAPEAATSTAEPVLTGAA